MNTTIIHCMDLADAARQIGISVADAKLSISQGGKWLPLGPRQARVMRTPDSDPLHTEMPVILEIDNLPRAA